MLHFREFGSYHEQRPTLVFLHGLFGSASNWQTVARALEPRFHLLVPDLRNHGGSTHQDPMDYASMADDLAAFIDDQGLDAALLVGHSMGGKAAMWLALQHSGMVSGLVVVDIAPVPYAHEFDSIFRALRSVDLEALESRGLADSRLAQYLPDPSLRQYLLQNLVKRENRWHWRFNLDLLIRDIEEITGFPEPPAQTQYPGPTLFLYGSASDYVHPEYRPVIQRYFPLARLRSIQGAGHWVYAERPQEFLSAVNAFLDKFPGKQPLQS